MNRFKPVVPFEHVEPMAHAKGLPSCAKRISKNCSMKTFSEDTFRLRNVFKNTKKIFTRVDEMKFADPSDGFPIDGRSCLVMRNHRYAIFLFQRKEFFEVVGRETEIRGVTDALPERDIECLCSKRASDGVDAKFSIYLRRTLVASS